MQNGLAWLDYLSDYDWDLFDPSQGQPCSGTRPALHENLNMGGRTLSEDTTKLLKSAHLLLTETPENLRMISKDRKMMCHDATQQNYRTVDSRHAFPTTTHQETTNLSGRVQTDIHKYVQDGLRTRTRPLQI